jgi:hypothetical protein
MPAVSMSATVMTTNAARPTWERLGDDFVTEPIGLVDVKGKGDVES